MTRDRLIDRVHGHELAELRRELYLTRRAMIDLMPEPVQRILESYYECSTRAETYRWEGSVIDEVLRQAQRLPKDGPYISNRANCPLCGRGSTAAYVEGFSLPEGLSRHLSGYGNVRQCDVMHAALGLARDHWDDAFLRQEEKEREEKARAAAKRKAGEPLFLIAPDREPVSPVDMCFLGRPARNANQLLWAEHRLATLGFQRTEKDGAISYTKETDAFTVFADPTMAGRIGFRVFSTPLPKKMKEPRLRSSNCRGFEMLDGWKHALAEKFQSRLETALRGLAPQSEARRPSAPVIPLRPPTET